MKRLVTYVLAAALAAMTVSSGCSGAGTAGNESPLYCNYSAADISVTEEEHTELAGFAARKGLSDGTHTPLGTHALVISDGEQKVCIISNDLMEMPPALAREIRTEISRKSGIDYERVLLHCIHTHSAPRLGGESALPGGSNASYKARTVETIVDNAVKAITDSAAFRPFILETAKGQTFINTNRCESGGPADHDLYAARFVDARTGETICSFFNLSCHPVCMGPASHLVSADYSGVARRSLKSDWGGRNSVFQLTGASGNMDPVGGCKDAAHAEKTGADETGRTAVQNSRNHS